MKKKGILLISIFIFFLMILNVKNYTNKRKPSQINQVNHINGYQPSQISHAYGIDKLHAKGNNQKIAIIEPYGSLTIEKDLEIFNNQFNLPSTKLQIFYPQGKPKAQIFGWALETSLDVEWVHALAPKASILLIISKSDSTNDLLNSIDFATNSGANIVSMSWTIPEFKEEVSYESHFQNKNIIFIASTGDNGSKINWPAVSPNVLAVGGTTFSLDSKGNLDKPETAWIESGGGVSKYMVEPKYQIDYGINSNLHRSIPDVSFYADSLKGVSVYCKQENNNDSGWTTLAGTSLGVPAWSAFLALVNENSSISINNIHDKLYKLAKNTEHYSIDFRDIKNGNTDLYQAKNGYDYVTGLGSPLENNLYNSLLIEMNK
ncbi:S53 family peptidase [Clostridium sp.]|jgi:subtilase family serine protease|uniref:S53 family peptidase n=1 Tax=Clostridium sp. TaxID=1506 RepID=UPI00258B05D7|nr:S53 family peptidase [Clostridium sp.]MDF2505174.1 peptidase and in kexin sedolisin [Clostridium sp.]